MSDETLSMEEREENKQEEVQSKRERGKTFSLLFALSFRLSETHGMHQSFRRVAGAATSCLSPSNSRKKVTNFTLGPFSSVCVQDCRPLLQQPPHALVSLSYFVPQTKSVQIFQTLFSCHHCLDTRTHDIWELHLSKRDVLETLKRIGRLRQGYQSCSPIRWGRFVTRKEVCSI